MFLFCNGYVLEKERFKIETGARERKMLKNRASQCWHGNCYYVQYHNYDKLGIDPEKPGGNKQ